MTHPHFVSYIRNRWPLSYAHPWAWGPTRTKQVFPWHWKLVLMTRYRGKEGWHYYRRDVMRVGHRAINFFLRSNTLRRFERIVRALGTADIRFSKRVLNAGWERRSLSEIHDTFQEWFERFSDFAAPMLTLDATDEVLETVIRQEIQRLHAPLRADVVAILLTPNEETYIQKEMRDFRQLVARYRSVKSAKTRRDVLHRHVRKWWWKDLGWGQYIPMTEQTLRQNVQCAASTTVSREQNHREARERRILLAKKRQLIKTLPKRLRQLLTIFETLAALHDYRKEVQMKMMGAAMELTRAIAVRRHVSLSMMSYFLPHEILALAKGRPLSLQHIRKRLGSFWCATTPHGIEFFTGQAAMRRIRRAALYTTTEKSDAPLFLQGIGASPGKITGEVRVGLEPKIVNGTIRQGEILVTGQTSPDFLPAMKKAGAVITDEGGITSHAAIVSRELGIPCIIGTKAATQLLSTGDVVEVNANHGTIKVLKRA